jgi:predicted metalloendopeptidase
LTTGENLADNNGLINSYSSYQLHIAKEGGAQPPISSSISNDKLFFLNFAQNWCTVMSPAYQKILLKTDPHSPAKFRVNGPVSNFAKFSEVFQCPAGSKMNRGEDSCLVFAQ